jgi:hypothetical protein
MAKIIVGIKYNGEHIRFEKWVYRYWRYGILRDPFLIRALESCKEFRYDTV